MASVLAAFLAFGFGIWEHIHDSPVSGFVFVCASVLLFWVGAYVAWYRTFDELEQIKRRLSSAAALKVTIEDLVKEPVDRKQGGIPLHVFVRAKVELEAPASASIKNFRLVISKHGATEILDSSGPSDVAKWDAMQWDLNPPSSFQFSPMPTSLVRGEPIEGWVRFVSQTPADLLMKSGLRLIVQTDCGSDHGETSSTPEMWNRNKTIVRQHA